MIPGRLRILICSRMLKSLSLQGGVNLYSILKILQQTHGMVHLMGSSYQLIHIIMFFILMMGQNPDQV